MDSMQVEMERMNWSRDFFQTRARRGAEEFLAGLPCHHEKREERRRTITTSSNQLYIESFIGGILPRHDAVELDAAFGRVPGETRLD